MKMKKPLFVYSGILLLSLLFLSGCNLFNSPAPAPPAMPTASLPHSTSTPDLASPAPPDAATPEACVFVSEGPFTLYSRPSRAADIFSTPDAGMIIEPTARTADGWLGFDPAIAQAANMGSFRLRWIAPDEANGRLTGDCAALPIVWGPPPGVCFFMPMEIVDIYEEPDTSSAVLAQLTPDEFAAINGMTADTDWAEVDLGPGNTGLTFVGWVDANTLNMNGPCASLPTVTP